MDELEMGMQEVNDSVEDMYDEVIFDENGELAEIGAALSTAAAPIESVSEEAEPDGMSNEENADEIEDVVEEDVAVHDGAVEVDDHVAVDDA